MIQGSKTTFYTGQKDVAVSGVPEQLPDQATSDGVSIVVKAKIDNTGNITVGNSSVNAKNDSGNCYVLLSGESISLPLTNSNKIWIDATVGGEGVEIIFET